nr:hypothetical protein [Tanacetum cinerariifolium]
MDQQYPTVAKIPEVLKFGDSYEVPANDPSTTTTNTTSGEASMKSGRTVTLTTEDMQKKKNDVKARTTLLLSLLEKHQLRFSKYKTARELWAVILKTFGGNEATKKTKKNLLKQQYGNFRAEGSETLEQTFTRLQVIVGQLYFMDVEVEQDDLNQKFLTSLAPEWLMHTIVWRNMSDLDTMSLDDLYNHLKVYETKVQKKTKPNTQNMAFISSAKHSRGNDKVNTASVYTASSNVPTASANVATELETLKQEKGVVDGKLAGLLTASKDLDNLIESQRPSPTVESSSEEDQNRNPSVFENVASPITPKPFVKFVKASDSQSKSKTGPDFVMKKKACFNCGDFNHLAYECRKKGSSQNKINDKGYWDSGCSRHMTGNISYLSDYEPFDGGYVSFGQGGCKITRNGTIKTECIVLGRYFKLLDDDNILLRTPRQHNMYSIDLNNIVPHRDLTCLVAKASADECMIWHRRLEAVNTACYVQNKVLVNKAHNKTPYELFNGRTPAIRFIKPFGCHVMILNTLENL